MKYLNLKLLFLFVFVFLYSCSKKEEIQFGLYPVKSANKWGYIDRKGNYIINPQFEEADFFFDGLACVGIKGDNENAIYGYVDNEGKYVINPQYKQASRFNEGIAWVVRTGNAPTAINNEGNELFTINDVEYVSIYSEGLSAFGKQIEEKIKWGYLNKKGEIAIPAIYENASLFLNGYAVVKNNKGKFGVINKKGALIIGYQYENISLFSDKGLACVESGGKWGAIDTKGKFVINPQFDQIYSDGDMFVIEQDGKYGWCDETGKIIITPQFKYIGVFSDNKIAPACIGDKWGYINKTGKWIINPQYIEAYTPINNLAQIRADGGYGLINNEGKYVVNPQFELMKFYYNLDYNRIESDYFDVDRISDLIKKKISDGKIDGLSISSATISQIMNKYSISRYTIKELIPLQTLSDAHFYLKIDGDFYKDVIETYSGYSFPSTEFNESAIPNFFILNIDLSEGKAANKGQMTFNALKNILGGDSGKTHGMNFILKGNNNTISIVFSLSDIDKYLAGYTDENRIYGTPTSDLIRIADSIAAVEAAAAEAAAAYNN